MSSREGAGILTKKNGDIYKGTFKNNKPNGDTEIFFVNGDHYKGNVIDGVITGQGELKCPNMKAFEGEFKDGKLHGEGRFYINEGTYTLESKFTEGVPEFRANKCLFKLISPVEEEEDPKAKKAPAKAPAKTDEAEELGGNPIKIAIDVSNPNEDQRKLGFSLEVVF